MTVLEEGSVWNTMPSHTMSAHGVYMYFEVPGDNVVFHMMGEPTETRHIVMKNEEAVYQPFLEHTQRSRHIQLYIYLGHGRREHGV